VTPIATTGWNAGTDKNVFQTFRGASDRVARGGDPTSKLSP